MLLPFTEGPYGEGSPYQSPDSPGDHHCHAQGHGAASQHSFNTAGTCQVQCVGPTHSTLCGFSHISRVLGGDVLGPQNAHEMQARGEGSKAGHTDWRGLTHSFSPSMPLPLQTQSLPPLIPQEFLCHTRWLKTLSRSLVCPESFLDGERVRGSLESLARGALWPSTGPDTHSPLHTKHLMWKYLFCTRSTSPLHTFPQVLHRIAVLAGFSSGA